MNRSVKRAGVLVGGTVLLGALFLSGQAESQIPPPPTLPPGFTIPTIPPPTMPPPTQPPPTMPPPTMPPPTMPPPTMPPPTQPPPTMPPPTLPSQADNAIQDVINRLQHAADEFGFDVQDIIDELIDLQNSN